MDWEGAGSLLRRGFDVQSHTMEHAVLSQETPSDQARDMTDARTTLERELETEITTLAYPHGTLDEYDASSVAAARAAGYRWAVTTREAFTRRATEPLEIPRVVMYPERGGAELLSQMRYLVPARYLAPAMASRRWIRAVRSRRLTR
jgi:peptidoglycan/xylan/chitin deacetylase (PgdA/CDA1 family)